MLISYFTYYWSGSKLPEKNIRNHPTFHDHGLFSDEGRSTWQWGKGDNKNYSEIPVPIEIRYSDLFQVRFYLQHQLHKDEVWKPTASWVQPLRSSGQWVVERRNYALTGCYVNLSPPRSDRFLHKLENMSYENKDHCTSQF